MFHTQADIETTGMTLEGLLGFTNTMNFPTPEQEKAGTQTALSEILGSIENIVLGTVLIKNAPKDQQTLATTIAAQQAEAPAPSVTTPTVLGFPSQIVFLIAAGLVLLAVVFLTKSRMR